MYCINHINYHHCMYFCKYYCKYRDWDVYTPLLSYAIDVSNSHLLEYICMYVCMHQSYKLPILQVIHIYLSYSSMLKFHMYNMYQSYKLSLLLFMHIFLLLGWAIMVRTVIIKICMYTYRVNINWLEIYICLINVCTNVQYMINSYLYIHYYDI